MILILNNYQILQENPNVFGWDLLITFLSATLGFLTALCVNRLIEKKQVNKELKKKKEQLKERLAYLNFSIIKAIEHSKKQQDNFKDLAKRIKENVYDFELPDYSASYNLVRLKEMDDISIFEAYSYYFDTQIDYLKDYKNIFTCADFLFYTYKELKEMHERHLKLQYDDQVFIRIAMEDIYMNVGIRALLIEKSGKVDIQKDPEYSYLLSILEKFRSLTKSVLKYKDVHQEFVLYINDTVLKSDCDIEFKVNLFAINKKALSRLYNIEQNSKLFAEDIISYCDESQPILTELEKLQIQINIS